MYVVVSISEDGRPCAYGPYGNYFDASVWRMRIALDHPARTTYVINLESPR